MAQDGIIWWNMLDCWPQISDAVVGLLFSTKAGVLLHRPRAACRLCMVCAEPENWCHKIFLCNDSNEAHTVRYIVRDGETRKRCVWARLCRRQ